MGWMKRWTRRLRALFRKEAVERELDEELAFHLELETQKNLRAGMSPEEARRQATLAFGGVERFKEEVRDARVLGWVTGMSLDLKLGLRMLVKYPGLTLVGGLAMAFAIAAGAVTFELVNELMHPKLPLVEGERVVGIRTRDARAIELDAPKLHDFADWREGLRTVQDLGAYQMVERNLIVPGGRVEPVRLTEISASAFRVARAAPLLGRTLVEEDERPGAPRVLVIGHDAWRTRFGGDPGVVGREVRLGRAPHTVVGVMPEGYGFPMAEEFWAPLRLSALGYARGEGPEVGVFGRLAAGATLEGAQAELAMLGRRAAADFPETHARFRPEVMPYAESILPVRLQGTMRLGVYSANLIALLFLALICANVAILVFARTATRESEMVVRGALGASRRRIVLQLFGEALVLGGAAAVVGLLAAEFGLRWGLRMFQELEGVRLPFWIDPGLSPATVFYAVLLTAAGALVVGLVPALKVTGRRLQPGLKRATAGSSALRFGGVWTAAIVAQVAFMVVLVPIIVDLALDAAHIRSAGVGVPADQYLSAVVRMDREALETDAAGAGEEELAVRLGATYAELERRILAEPGVIGVTYTSALPGEYRDRSWIDVDGVAAPADAEARRVQTAAVDPDFFAVMQVPVLAGRGFTASDAGPDSRVVVVNESFVREVLGGQNPIGQRVRYRNAADPDEWGDGEGKAGPWHEIVGVVKEVRMTTDPDLLHNAGFYHPAPVAPGPLRVAVHLRGDPASFAPRLRALALATDPSLRLHRIMPLDEIVRDWLLSHQLSLRVAVLAGVLLLLLSCAGIYSIVSFTVARRTREIGIRSALGANPRRIVATILARSLAQIGLGVALGAGLLVLMGGGVRSLHMLGLVAMGVGVMLSVGMFACMLPALRALRIAPTEALRADA